MGIIADDKREIRFFYNSQSSLGKRALGYIRASNKKVLDIDVINTKVTATQWAELATGLNKHASELVDKEHPDFINEFGKNVDLSDEHDWLDLLENQPHILKQPIILNGKDFKQIKSPSEVNRFLKSESYGIKKN